MSLTVATFAITAALCYGIFRIIMWQWQRRHLYKLSSKFEGPPALPFIGNGHLFFGNSENLLDKLSEMCTVFPSPYRIWLGPNLIITITDPEHAKAILLSPETLGKGYLLDSVRPLVGTGIFTAPVPKWKVHRKLIRPTFNTKILDTFVEIFSAHSKILTDRMDQTLDGPEFEIFKLIFLCNLDIICETAMGVNLGTQTNKNLYYVEAQQNVLAGFCKRLFNPWLYPDFIFYLTEIGKNERKYLKFLHDFVDNVIQMKKRELLERSNQPDITANNEDDTFESSPRKKAFLDHMMTPSHDNINLSEEELRDEVEAMMLGGNGPAATIDSYVMLMLASHQDVQEKVYQELHEIYGDNNVETRPVSSEDLSRMKYLECVIKETMRLFPPVPFIIRNITNDFEMGDHTLPNGSTAALGILPIHRNEKYWPDPLKFDPDRFLPKEIAKRHPNAFIAFSAGPRNCIGLNFAMMSMKTLIATVLRRYILKKDDVVPIKNIRLKLEILMEPVDPIKIRIERRNKNCSALL